MSFPGPPVMIPCTNPNPPVLPDRWSAAVLLTPFGALPPLVAEVEYDASLNAMFVGCLGLSGGALGLLVIGDGTFWMLPDWPSAASMVGPIQATNWVVPPTDWLGSNGAACQGLAPVLGTMSEWWSSASACTNGCEHEPCDTPTCGTWLWCDAVTRHPWRMMSIDKSNPYKLPVLGDFAMVHFASFTPGEGSVAAMVEAARRHGTRRHTGRAHGAAGAWTGRMGTIARAADLHAQLQRNAAQADADRRAAIARRVMELIPGLTPLQGSCAPYRLPTWSDRLYMNAITVPTSVLQPYPTEVFYQNAPNRPNQASRFYRPDGSREDIILDATTTYAVTWKDGTATCSAPSPPGLPYTNWAERDGCQCALALTNGPLSPNRTTIAFCCPSDHGRVFWIWYTDRGQGVMFMEVPQLCDVTFTLIDYDVWMPDPSNPFPPDVFDVPKKCR